MSRSLAKACGDLGGFGIRVGWVKVFFVVFGEYGVDNERRDVKNEPKRPEVLKYQDGFSSRLKGYASRCS
ncbi:MAG: hypothetical protein ACYS32_10665 [Planctomycetota bacterium]|jgi:hypothetical protein